MSKTECANCKRLTLENHRMLTAIEAMLRISKDMLDPVRRAGPTAPASEEMKAFGQAEWFPPEGEARISEPHKPTMKEIIDMDTPSLWDVVFSDKDAEGLLVRETRRGPYSSPEQAKDYGERNPERLPGDVSVRTSIQETRN